MLEFVEDGLAALDVEANVVSLHELLDGIGKLATTPVFKTVNLPAVAGDDSLIAFDHGGHLLALIRMHNKHYFVVTHELHSLWISFQIDGNAKTQKGAARPKDFGSSKKPTIIASPRQI
jgi:hypothetical protein